MDFNEKLDRSQYVYRQFRKSFTPLADRLVTECGDLVSAGEYVSQEVGEDVSNEWNLAVRYARNGENLQQDLSVDELSDLIEDVKKWREVCAP